MKKFDLEEKFPRLVVVKISNGFLVGIFPQNKEIEKMMANYVKNFVDTMTATMEGDDWKIKMQENINSALKVETDDNVKLYACKDAFEVMNIIAPVPEGDEPKKGNPNLSWFWSENGHIPD